MSEIPKSFSSLIVSLPNSAIVLQALFICPESFISTLDIDYTGLLSNFPNFSSLSLMSHIVAHIKETCENFLSSKIQIHPSNQIICSSREDSFSSIFVILPKLNPFITKDLFEYSHILLRFSIEDLHGRSSIGILNYIDNVNKSINSIQNVNIELYSKIQETCTNNSAKIEKKNQLEQRIAMLSGDLSSYTRNIIKLHYEYEALEIEEEKCGIRLRCIMCENNLKNVIFIPCGHLLICQECLQHNLKTEPNIPIERRRKLLTCHNCKTKVRETRVISFNSHK